MKFNLHHTSYPFPLVNGVTIEAEDAESALQVAMEWHACKDNPHPAVSPQDGHPGDN